MRFLVDANLSPVVASALRDAGHDAVHVVDLGVVTADDDHILEAAAQDDRVILTAEAAFWRAPGDRWARQALRHSSSIS